MIQSADVCTCRERIYSIGKVSGLSTRSLTRSLFSFDMVQKSVRSWLLSHTWQSHLTRPLSKAETYVVWHGLIRSRLCRQQMHFASLRSKPNAKIIRFRRRRQRRRQQVRLWFARVVVVCVVFVVVNDVVNNNDDSRWSYARWKSVCRRFYNIRRTTTSPSIITSMISGINASNNTSSWFRFAKSRKRCRRQSQRSSTASARLNDTWPRPIVGYKALANSRTVFERPQRSNLSNRVSVGRSLLCVVCCVFSFCLWMKSNYEIVNCLFLFLFFRL